MKSRNTIKSKLFDLLEKIGKATYTRQEIIDAYDITRGFHRWSSHLATSLCAPSKAARQGYFCFPTRDESRYLKRVKYNTYALIH